MAAANGTSLALMTASTGTFENRRDRGRKARAIGHPLVHALGKRFLSIQEDEVAAPLQASNIEHLSIQMLHDPVPVCRGGDDDRRLVVSKAFGQKIGDESRERFSVPVEADGVKMADFDGSFVGRSVMHSVSLGR